MNTMKALRLTSLCVVCLMANSLWANHIAVRCMHDNKYVTRRPGSDTTFKADKTGIQSGGTFTEVFLGGNRRAFLCQGNGKYLRVHSDGLIKADSNDYSTADKQFDLVESINGYWAWKSVSNQHYVSTDLGTMYANKTSITSNKERFQHEYAYDMWVAFRAFSDNYPNKVKLARNNQNIVLGKDKMFNNINPWWYILYPDYRFHPWGHAAWDYMGLTMIGDWEYIVLLETQEQFQKSPAWPNGIPRIKRYWHATYNQDPELTHSIYTPWRWLELNCTYTAYSAGSEWYTVYPSEIRNFSYAGSQVNMGNRWVVPFGYKDHHEIWWLDLGPAKNNFNPKYGIVRYENLTHPDPGYWGWADFINIQNDHMVFNRRCPK